jgi:hypothetical protein
MDDSDKKKERIIILKKKCSDMIRNICGLINDNNKYVFSEACDENIKLYFKWIDEYQDLEKKI